MVLEDLSQENPHKHKREIERERFNFVYLFGVLSKGEI
jgi:hypothetical protein